jgi:hypothetical protein
VSCGVEGRKEVKTRTTPVGEGTDKSFQRINIIPILDFILDEFIGGWGHHLPCL